MPEKLLGSLEILPNLVFAQIGDRQLRLDLYRPKAQGAPLPAIVCIHGGGWFKGDRTGMTNLAQAMAARGFVAVTIDYRLSGEAKFPAAIQDCKAAVRWLRANARWYGIDAKEIGVTGLSAGGHLAALLATSGGVTELEGDGGNPEQSSAVQAVVAMGAQSDLENERIRDLSSKPNDPFYRTFLGVSQAENPKLYALASPRHHLDKSDPPLAFMAGELDDPSTHADEMRHDMMELGIPGGLTVIPRAPHAFLSLQRAFDLCVKTCDTFFTLHLKDHDKPLVQCDVPGLFPEGAHWQLIGGGYAGCEGVQWIGDTLHFAGHHDHFAFVWTEARGLKVWRDDSPEATSFRPDGKGGYYVVEQTTRRLTRWNAAGQMTEVLADKFEGKRLNRPNDVIVKSDGTLWFTDPDFLFKQRPQDVKELDGQYVYRFDPNTKQLTAVVRDADVLLPNGIAFSPDEKWLFVTDTGSVNVYRWPVNADGTLGAREVFAKFPEKGLDGAAFDPAGHLWIATNAGIQVLNLDGHSLGLIKTPGKPTSFDFGPHGRVCVTVHDACFISTLALSSAVAPALPAFEWKTVSPSPIPRLEEAAMMVNGKFYLFGGFTTSAGSTSARVDVYDIAKDSWSQLKDMPAPVNHLNAAVDGNTAWFAGGFKGNNPGKATAEVWKYDIAADAWSAGPPLPEPRGAGALAVAGRELHFFGGFKADRNTNCADHWVLSLDDPKEWKGAADLPDARGHLSTAVLNGKIYAFGGQHGHDPVPVDVDSCHVFDTSTGQWSAIAKLPFPHSHFESSTIIHNGRIIIVGGRSNSSLPARSAVNNVTEYDPATDSWRELGTIPQNLAAPAATIFGGKIIVSCGGLNGTSHPQATTIIAPLPPDSSKRSP